MMMLAMMMAMAIISQMKGKSSMASGRSVMMSDGGRWFSGRAGLNVPTDGTKHGVLEGGYAQPSRQGSGTYMDGIPQAMIYAGQVNPYKDLPHHSRTERGLPEIRHRFQPSAGRVGYGANKIFSANQAERDLDVMKDFGLISSKKYKQEKTKIRGPDFPGSRSSAPSVHLPEGWGSPTATCREVTTKVAGLSQSGWAQMNTLKCCDYLCTDNEWRQLRDGKLIWGMGSSNRYSSALHTPGAIKLADGSNKFMCRTCAWNKEPSWDEFGLNNLPKMEGHLCNATSPSSATGGLDLGGDGIHALDDCPEEVLGDFQQIGEGGHLATLGNGPAGMNQDGPMGWDYPVPPVPA